MPRSGTLFLAVVFTVVSLPAAGAQSATGTVSGRVDDASGLAVPGVTVSVNSPNLQGVRATVTSGSGNYVLPLLPPGPYTIRFELDGFATLIEQRDVAATELVALDATLQPAGVEETVTVRAARPDMFVGTVQSASTMTAETMDLLPTVRSLQVPVGLAPARSLSFAPMISGGMSFENVYLLNGVQITDNVRNTPNPLYIEDAIQEVTVATSGISAEYGRFAGGMINAVTRSGGNVFSGSFRATLQNDNWRTVSPFGEEKVDDTEPTSEFTIGGPIVADRTWFFGAGRFQTTHAARTLFATGLPYEFENDNRRYEVKVTQSFGSGQSLKVAYTGVRSNSTNSSSGQILDARSLYDPVVAEGFLSVHYTGVATSTLFLEGQFSSRQETLSDFGGSSTDRIEGTGILDFARNATYWAPPFCAVCGDEERDNTELLLKGTSFVPTGAGSHTLTFGYDLFDDRRRDDNHQTASDYAVATPTSRIVDGVPYPVLVPGHPLTFIVYQPILESSRGTAFKTHSLFLNDTWRANERLTLSLGLRWDGNDGQDSAGQVAATGSRLSPRVGVVWDPNARGQWTVAGSYSHYVASIANRIGDAGSGAGRPALFAWPYLGPPINVNPLAPLVPTDQALETVFAWFDSVGGESFRPYRLAPVVPGLTTRVDGSLGSPWVVEYSGGVSRRIGSQGAIRADLTYRDYRDFYASFTDLGTGQVTDSFGQTFDLTLVGNTNDLTREYVGLTLQGSYRVGTRVNVAGNYTLARLWGNTVGETRNSGPIADSALSYPEYADAAWNNPEGDLLGDRRHTLNVWGTYQIPTTRQGTLTVSGIERVRSGYPYSAVGSALVAPFVPNPGYATPPLTRDYYFEPRDALREKSIIQTDVAVQYRHRLPGATRADVFVQAQIYNVFNQFRLYQPDRTILTGLTSPAYQTFNPFTTTPVQGVHWDTGPDWGQAVGAGSYTQPRTLIITFGSRF